MYIEAIEAMDINLIIFRLVLAIIIGGIIGAEREYQNKSAGFRTMMLICMGSALFTIISMELSDTHTPDRIASNIVTGIGFIGGLGGVIIGWLAGQGLNVIAIVYLASQSGQMGGAPFNHRRATAPA